MWSRHVLCAGSLALQKVKEAVLGPTGHNLEDLSHFSGTMGHRLPIPILPSAEFLHTGQCESINSVTTLKYLPKSVSFR